MDKPLDEEYFLWLCRQVGSVESSKIPSRNYWRLLKRLYTKEFVWIIPNDDNRAEDGRNLQYEFVKENKIDDVDPGWLGLGCSMFELLVGLSRRLSFEADGEPRDWFWHMIENIGLERYNDNAHIPEKEVDEILDDIIWRTYRRNGRGGLFPLRKATDDQRDVELWYQLNAYLLEH